ncbi:MAG: Mut7-C RNAse domain-containing protein [Pseudanabaenales cyanobacterium]|nr:Mut7-C RNAse domain-containing protein [Pseudanabaenales cyanobacterium]
MPVLWRCLRCNGLLQPVAKAAICDRLEPLTKQYYDEFRICQDCDQIYWKGFHYARMQRLIDDGLQSKLLS